MEKLLGKDLLDLHEEIEAEEEALQETKWNSVHDDLKKVEERVLSRSKLLNNAFDTESLSDEEDFMPPKSYRNLADDESYSSLIKIANQKPLLSPQYVSFPYGNPLPEPEKPVISESSKIQLKESQVLAEQLANEIRSLREEIINLKQDKRILLITNQNLQDELFKSENKLGQAERRLLQSQSKFDHLEGQYQSQQKESKELYEKYQTLKQSYQELEWKFDLEKKEKEDLLIQHQTLQVKYKEYQLIIVDLEKKIQESLRILQQNDTRMRLEQQKYDVFWQEYKGLIQTIQDKILLPHQHLLQTSKKPITSLPLLTWDCSVEKIEIVRETNLSLFSQLYEHFYHFKISQKEFEEHKKECKSRKQQLMQIIHWYEEMVPIDLPQLLSVDESTLKHLLPPKEFVTSPKAVKTPSYYYKKHKYSEQRRNQHTQSNSNLEDILKGIDSHEDSEERDDDDEDDLNVSSLPAFSISKRN